MGKSAGSLKKIVHKGVNINLTQDNEVNFYPGGWIATEALVDIGGASPKKMFEQGRLTGITQRCVEPGSLAKADALIHESADGNGEDCLFELSNGDKWSGRVFAVGDPASYFGNGDGKLTFELHALDGYFKQVS